ncbi:MAG: hypothetical protein HZY76_03910 [Anaerolineae bacterium]|nr:MAG: hypothetical protein HZY76_03910 [Anaerolineae bacterium]
MVYRRPLLLGIGLTCVALVLLAAAYGSSAAAQHGAGPTALRLSGSRHVASPSTAGPLSTLTSSQLSNCLAVDANIHESEATVFLTWTGTVSAARLKLDINNARPGHSIYLNGTRIGAVPNWTGGSGYCATTGITTTLLLSDPGMVRNGVNTIKITNDADPNDSWSVARGVLEVDGDVQGATYREFGYYSSYPPQSGYQRRGADSGQL